MHHAWVLHRARSVLIVKKVLVPGLFNSISNLVREHNSKLKNYWNRNHLQKNFKIHKLVESKLLNLQIANHWSQSPQLLSVLKSLASDHPRHKKRQVMKKIRAKLLPPPRPLIQTHHSAEIHSPDIWKLVQNVVCSFKPKSSSGTPERVKDHHKLKKFNISLLSH